MQEMKPPKKPFVFYYVIALVVLLLVNFLLIPQLKSQKVQEVDYSTFLNMVDQGQVGYVNIGENQITFTDGSGQNIFKTGVLNDIELVSRLNKAGVKFTGEIVQETSPVDGYSSGTGASYDFHHCCGAVYDEENDVQNGRRRRVHVFRHGKE